MSVAKMMMKWHIFATIILIQLKTFHCNTIEISSYSRVAKNTNTTTTTTPTATNEEPTKNNDQPSLHIHRAREGVINSDLWFPKTFNDTNMINVNTADKSNGRSINSNNKPSFPFPLKNTIYSTFNEPSNHQPKIIYASSPVSQIAMDRFVPHETAEHFIEKNKRNRVKFSSSIKESDREDDSQQQQQQQTDAAANNRKPPAVSEGYTPPTNLYAFPPNIDAAYPPPGYTRKPISISSYLPPPSGPTNYPIYPGPVMPKPDPPFNPQMDNMQDNPRPDLDDGNGDTNMDNGSPDRPSDDTQQILSKPPSGPNVPSLPFLDHDHDDHSHDHHHEHNFVDHPPFAPFSDDSLKHLHGFEAYPEIIVDDTHHDYFDHHHPHPHPRPPFLPIPLPLPPTTTPLPPPPPPPEPEDEPEEDEQPRVKKYSYFYLSRSLWYIPLYFTVWFTFYVTWLILQSIGRHKVDLPNHTISRRSVRDLTHKETVDKVNILTEFVMSQIEEFKEKYL